MRDMEVCARADQKRMAKDELEATLLEALRSEPEAVTPEWWAKRREDIGAGVEPSSE